MQFWIFEFEFAVSKGTQKAVQLYYLNNLVRICLTATYHAVLNLNLQYQKVIQSYYYNNLVRICLIATYLGSFEFLNLNSQYQKAVQVNFYLLYSFELQLQYNVNVFDPMYSTVCNVQKGC
jgi:hypothetical protein